MAGLFSKVTRFARSPQGQQAIRKVQDAAKDPATRRKIDSGVDRVRQEVTKRRGGGGQTGGGQTGGGQTGGGPAGGTGPGVPPGGGAPRP